MNFSHVTATAQHGQRHRVVTRATTNLRRVPTPDPRRKEKKINDLKFWPTGNRGRSSDRLARRRRDRQRGGTVDRRARNRRGQHADFRLLSPTAIHQLAHLRSCRARGPRPTHRRCRAYREGRRHWRPSCRLAASCCRSCGYTRLADRAAIHRHRMRTASGCQPAPRTPTPPRSGADIPCR